MLLDKYLRTYHFRERHAIKINSASPDIYRLMLRTDLSKSGIIRILFKIRGMPDAGVLSEIEKLGFVRLEENIGHEIVYGMISTSWVFGRCMHDFISSEFISHHHADHIKAAINFRIDTVEGKTEICTETRVLCGSDRIKNKFKVYWFFVRPFSGLIRRLMLKEIKKTVLHSPGVSTKS